MPSDDLMTTCRSHRHHSTVHHDLGEQSPTASIQSLQQQNHSFDDDTPVTLHPIVDDGSGKVLSNSLFTVTLPKKLTESMPGYVWARNNDDLSLELLENSKLDVNQHLFGTHVFDIYARLAHEQLTCIGWLQQTRQNLLTFFVT